MKSQDEIVARVEKLLRDGDDVHGHRREVLVPRLDWERARPFFPEGTKVTRKDWAERPQVVMSVTEEADAILKRGILAAHGHDGPECVRVVTNLAEYAWLLNGELALKAWKIRPWPQFGVPTMKWAADLMVLPTWWRARKVPEIRNMAEGRPCMEGCERGCR